MGLSFIRVCVHGTDRWLKNTKMNITVIGTNSMLFLYSTGSVANTLMFLLLFFRIFLNIHLEQVLKHKVLCLPSELNSGFCLNKPKLITRFSLRPPLGTWSLQKALNLPPSASGSTSTVSPPSHTCDYPDCRLKLTSQHTPAALAVFFGCLPKWPVRKISPRTSAENAPCLLSRRFLIVGP